VRVIGRAGKVVVSAFLGHPRKKAKYAKLLTIATDNVKLLIAAWNVRREHNDEGAYELGLVVAGDRDAAHPSSKGVQLLCNRVEKIFQIGRLTRSGGDSEDQLRHHLYSSTWIGPKYGRHNWPTFETSLPPRLKAVRGKC